VKFEFHKILGIEIHKVSFVGEKEKKIVFSLTCVQLSLMMKKELHALLKSQK
jgi:hypothetical protein